MTGRDACRPAPPAGECGEELPSLGVPHAEALERVTTSPPHDKSPFLSHAVELAQVQRRGAGPQGPGDSQKGRSSPSPKHDTDVPRVQCPCAQLPCSVFSREGEADCHMGNRGCSWWEPTCQPRHTWGGATPVKLCAIGKALGTVVSPCPPALKEERQLGNGPG